MEQVDYDSDSSDSTVEIDGNREWLDEQDDTASESSSDEEQELDISEVDAVLVYSKTQLLSTTSSQERRYLRRRPGICAGLSLAWLQLVVRDDVDPGNCWPQVSFARQLQEYIEDNSVRHTYFPEVAYMSEEEYQSFSDVDDGLRHIWHNPGSYILLIRAKYARIGHAVAYSDRYSYPRGYLMNPNKGAHCCHTYRGLSDEFRSDNFIRRAESSYHGPEFIIIRIGKPHSDYDSASWHANETQWNAREYREDVEYVQYGV